MCNPLFKLLKKDTKIEWTDECQVAFDRIKQYLLNPSILVPPTPGHLLILYIAVQETSKGCMLGQLNEPNQKEKAIITSVRSSPVVRSITLPLKRHVAP